MKVYILHYEVGVSSGYKELIGIYSSMEELEKGKAKDKEEYYACRVSGKYVIQEIEIDKNINTVYCEW
jgi:hypothetical protein